MVDDRGDEVLVAVIRAGLTDQAALVALAEVEARLETVREREEHRRDRARVRARRYAGRRTTNDL